MSIERFYGPGGTIFTPICDTCGEELPGGFDFQAAVTAKKQAGWKSRKVGGEWEDFCGDCQSKEKECLI